MTVFWRDQSYNLIMQYVFSYPWTRDVNEFETWVGSLCRLVQLHAKAGLSKDLFRDPQNPMNQKETQWDMSAFQETCEANTWVTYPEYMSYTAQYYCNNNTSLH